MAGTTVDYDDEGPGASPLAPVVDIGWPAGAELVDLPMLAPSPVPAVDHAALGDILADSLFGEVIEISDLIPHLLEPGTEQAAAPVEPAAVVAEPPAADTGGDMLAGSVPFSILFDEDGSSGHGTL